jgi:hypothetical protein
MAGERGKPVLPPITTGKPQRADGTKDHTPPQSSWLSPSRRTRESLQGQWQEARETRTARSKALQAVRWGIVVGVWENHIPGEGPEGEGR